MIEARELTKRYGDTTAVHSLSFPIAPQHLLRDLAGAGEVYPDAIWPVQIADALRELIHHANLARQAGAASINEQVRDGLIGRFRNRVRVGLSATTSHGSRPGERKALRRGGSATIWRLKAAVRAVAAPSSRADDADVYATQPSRRC
ncbi:MAG: hypothetical protein L0H41_15985 [Microlunatus sp.]|uniref:hypothetical protein n=1 Tax=Intrasporangium sp. TaxID=1925024 RepID=UPI002649F421|nr:hypothetical protein [Intrasporangium sp.]MDN5763804.1 hypothetical protein [Microlunatus sp.]MDN5796389.1 hypothetical protein [Intrasporangium sp.]